MATRVMPIWVWGGEEARGCLYLSVSWNKTFMMPQSAKVGLGFSGAPPPPALVTAPPSSRGQSSTDVSAPTFHLS